MDHAEQETVRRAAQRAVDKDQEQGTHYTSNWLETQRTRLAHLKASLADLEDIIAIYDAALATAARPDYESLTDNPT